MVQLWEGRGERSEGEGGSCSGTGQPGHGMRRYGVQECGLMVWYGHGMGWSLLVVRVRGRKGLGALRGLVTCVCVVYRIWILEIWPPHV